jgi:hypothetical protein
MDWKNELLQARKNWYLKKYQVAREFGVPALPKPYNDDSTNGLTKCIYDWLKYHDHYVNRIQSQGQVRVEKIPLAFGNVREKIVWTHGTTNKGTADIDSIIFGKPVKIEVKCSATKDRLSDHQLKEKKRIESSGGIYYVATNMQTFIEWYKQTFKIVNSIN